MLYCQNPKCIDPFIADDYKNCPHCQSTNLSSIFHQYYQVISLIDSGGFGKIYLASNTQNNHQQCVIKQLNIRHYNSAQIVKIKELFNREVEQLKMLNHPQIPKFYDRFIENDRLYLVQEYIKGNTLATELKDQGVFGEQKILELLVSILPVLKFIHSQKIIHRDLKPENIIRRANSQELVLVDFGSSKLIMGSYSTIKSGTIIGSPQYTAPEQAKGKPRYNSDLYSLGFTCLYLITRLNLFDLYDTTDNKYKWRDYLGENKISPLLGNILDKLIEEDCNTRYQSVEEVWQDLQKITPNINNLTFGENISKKIELNQEKKLNLSETLEEIGGLIFPIANRQQLIEIGNASIGLLEIRLNEKTISKGSCFLYK